MRGSSGAGKSHIIRASGQYAVIPVAPDVSIQFAMATFRFAFAVSR